MTLSRRTSRREFMAGRSAVEALADLTHGTDDAPPLELPTARTSGLLIHVARRAMACEFEVFLDATRYAQGADQALAALDLVEQLEEQLTVYRDTSEVMHINRTAFDEPVPVEPRLMELFRQAMRLHEETGGAFDITAGPLSKAWGFYRRQGMIPTEEALAEALARVGSRQLQLDEPPGAIRFRQSGVEINLGAIGKGYALDRMAELLLEAGIGDFLLHGGQSSVLARGTHWEQMTDEGGGWAVGVIHPEFPQRRLAEIRLHDQALGTSGSATQFFRHRGRRYGHILDPRTGWPVEGVLSTTVVAPTAALADALATACYVLGGDAALDYCQRRGDVGLVVVRPGQRSGAVQVDAVGFAEGQIVFAA